MIRRVLFLSILVLPSSSFSSDLEDNNISISVNGNTTVLSKHRKKFQVKNTSINDDYIDEATINNKLKINSVVNSIVIDCNSFLSCAKNKDFHIKTNENSTLIGNGAINSIIINN